ncbi:MAG: hypothetical protein PHD48_04280 [Alphaproteobacteria bacterium]|nr:hypothetical protein [Alphaproteobacteria bacterium]
MNPTYKMRNRFVFVAASICLLIPGCATQSYVAPQPGTPTAASTYYSASTHGSDTMTYACQGNETWGVIELDGLIRTWAVDGNAEHTTAGIYDITPNGQRNLQIVQDIDGNPRTVYHEGPNLISDSQFAKKIVLFQNSCRSLKKRVRETGISETDPDVRVSENEEIGVGHYIPVPSSLIQRIRSFSHN